MNKKKSMNESQTQQEKALALSSDLGITAAILLLIYGLVTKKGIGMSLLYSLGGLCIGAIAGYTIKGGYK
jgi:F0F1-type ATP synthase assembly protein I